MKKKRLTAAVFEYATVRYLSRYMATESMLRRVLNRRAKNFVYKHGGSLEEAGPLIDAEVEKRLKDGSINDERFAQLLIESLQKQGNSKPKMRQKLRNKGIKSTIIQSVLENREGHNLDYKSACRYAKKRGFGPYRKDPVLRSERRQKDLASMVRAGHAYGLSKKVLDAPTIESLYEEEE